MFSRIGFLCNHVFFLFYELENLVLKRGPQGHQTAEVFRHSHGQNPSCMGLLTHKFSKLVHDTKGKELNFNDPSLESGSVSGAGILKGLDGCLPSRRSQSRWDIVSQLLPLTVLWAGDPGSQILHD